MEPISRLVAWNVCQGGGERIDRITAALASLAPDVVILSEVTLGRHDKWVRALPDIGLKYQLSGIASVAPADPYAVMIASTHELEEDRWPLSPPFPNRAVRVRVGGLSVSGIHAPLKPVPGREFYEWLATAVCGSLNAEAVLLGDFNADESGAGMVLNPFFLPLIEAGWVHGTRRHNPGGNHASWWRGKTGFAADHGLLSPTLAARLGRAVIVDEINGKPTAGPNLRFADGALSDHRPILVDLRLPGGPSGEP